VQRDFQARICSGYPWAKKNYSRAIDQRLELLCNFHDSLSFFTHFLVVYLCTLYCAFTPYTVSVRGSPSCFQIPIKKDLYWDCVSCLLAHFFFIGQVSSKRRFKRCWFKELEDAAFQFHQATTRDDKLLGDQGVAAWRAPWAWLCEGVANSS